MPWEKKNSRQRTALYRAVLLSGVRDYYDGLFFGGDGAAAVGLQQFLQIGYPAGNGLTVVDIPDELAAWKFSTTRTSECISSLLRMASLILMG